jgi:hypothetical protein
MGAGFGVSGLATGTLVSMIGIRGVIATSTAVAILCALATSCTRRNGRSTSTEVTQDA